MQSINERIQNPVFFLSFFGAVLALLAALVAHSSRPRSGHFRLVVLACVLYIGGGFLLTVFVNVPLNEQLAGVATNASPGALAAATAGSVLGAAILYAVGRWGGRTLVLRYGRVLQVKKDDLERAEGWFDRYGGWPYSWPGWRRDCGASSPSRRAPSRCRSCAS